MCTHEPLSVHSDKGGKYNDTCLGSFRSGGTGLFFPLSRNMCRLIINPVRRELTFFVSKSCDPDFKQTVKRHRVGTLVGC